MRKRILSQCPFVTAQSILQGKWAILILHHLSEGPVRFNELQKKIKITQATLSTQLKSLEKDGLISRTVFPEVPPHVEYSLTEIGNDFLPALEAIRIWGEKYTEYLLEQGAVFEETKEEETEEEKEVKKK